MAGPVELQGSGEYFLEIVGESHYQAALESICGGKTREGHSREVKALLTHDNKNPHDSQAVKVEIQGKTVGYLDRQHARYYRKTLAAGGFKGRTARCNAIIVGGWDRGNGDVGHYGVKLDIGTRT